VLTARHRLSCFHIYLKGTLMNKVHASLVALGASCLACTSASAATYSFNAVLNAGNEVPPVSSPATGLATLVYDDLGTPTMTDDTYDFAMSVFDLTGPATAYHIHGAAAEGENAPVRVSLDAAPFVSLNVGGSLLVGGNDIVAPASIPATVSPPGPNPGYPAMSFLEMLQGGLAYVNVHTAAFPGGEVRGQLLQVTAVPEPGTWAMLLAGIAAIGTIVRRRVHDR
jgi:hypothetical protein